MQGCFICCCCAFGHCAWFHPPQLRELTHEAHSPGTVKPQSADSANKEHIYKIMFRGKYVVYM